MGKKRGQVWIETVIYTMIAFVLIATVLAFVKPKIEEMQDEIIIDRSISILKEIDSMVLSVLTGAQGNKRLIEVELKKGELVIDGIEDRFFFEIFSKSKYSEFDVWVENGNINILTEKKTGENKVTLKRELNKTKYNVTHNLKDEEKRLAPGSTAYKVFISNNGSLNNKQIVNFEVG